MMKKSFILTLVVLACFVVGCSRKPVLYDNAKYKRVGKSKAEDDITACMDKAEEAGAKGDSAAEKAGYNAGRGAASGTAAAAVGGAIYNKGSLSGRGIAAGAGGGAAGSFFWHLFDREPDPIFRNYVNKCLADKGYHVIGWS